MAQVVSGHDKNGEGGIRILEWVAFPFSRGSSQPGDRSQVSNIAGRFFTSWATREALKWHRNTKHCINLPRGSLLMEYSNHNSSMGFQGVYTLSIILLNILPKDTRKIHNIQELNISESLELSCDGYSILTHMVSNFFSLVLGGHSPWKQGTRVKKGYSTWHLFSMMRRKCPEFDNE